MGQKQSKPEIPGRSDKPRKRWSFRTGHRSSRQQDTDQTTTSAGSQGESDKGKSRDLLQKTQLNQRKTESDESCSSEGVNQESPQEVPQPGLDLQPVDAYPDDDLDVAQVETAIMPIGEENTMAFRTQQGGSNNRTYNIGPQSTVHIYEGSATMAEKDEFDASFQFPVEVCQNALKSHYESEMGQLHPLAWNEDFMMKTDDIFTDVDLLLQSPQGGTVSRKLLSSVAEALVARPDCSCPRRVLIEGQPGVGKTTTLFKLVVDWTKGDNHALAQFDLVFYLALRKVAESQSLADCIFDQLLPEDSTFDKADLEGYLRTTDKNVLIVLDGYDEWEPEESHDINKVLCGKILRDCSVIVSTRPSRTSDLLKMMRPDTRLEINGFHPDNVSTYVLKYFSNDVAKAKTLLEKLNSNFLSSGIILTPMFLLLICILWQERDDLLMSDHVCPLYDQLILYLITRFCAREDILFVDDKLPPNINATVLLVEKLAFDGLMRGKLVFEEEDVSLHSKDALDTLLRLGLLHKQPSPSKLRPSPQYSFSHKTMQEYFAGRHMASYLTAQTESSGRALMEENFGTVRKVREMDNVLIFACGRLGRKASVIFQHLSDLHQKDLEPLEADFYTFYDRGILDKNWVKYTKLDNLASKDDYLFLEVTGLFADTPAILSVYQSYLETALLCYYEWGQMDGFIERFTRRGIIQVSSPTPRVCNALAQLMKCGRICQVQQDVPSRMTTQNNEEFPQKSMVLRLMHTRQFCFGPILATLGACSCIVELNLRQSSFGLYGPTVTRPSLQLSRQLPHLKRLRKLVLSWNDLQPEDARVLLPAIGSLKVLEELYLSGNNLSGTCDVFCNILPSLPALKILKVFDCRMTYKEILPIGRALMEHCKKMYKFDFDNNRMGFQQGLKIQRILKFATAEEDAAQQMQQEQLRLDRLEVLSTSKGRRMFDKLLSGKTN